MVKVLDNAFAAIVQQNAARLHQPKLDTQIDEWKDGFADMKVTLQILSSR